MKYIILLVSIITVANISQKGIDTKQLIDNVYFSSQSSTDEFFCNVFLHFDRDSLYVFNTASYPKNYKFKIDYYKNRIELSNQALNNYELKMLKNDQKITLLDKSNKIAYNDSIKLNKIKIGTIDQKLLDNPPNSYWGEEINRMEENDSLIYSFDKLDDSLDYHILNTYYKSKSKTQHTERVFNINSYSDHFNLINLSWFYFLISNFSKDNITFISHICPDQGILKNSLKKLKISKKTDITGTWKKIKSKKEVSFLPDSLKFDEDYIYIKKRKLEYITALNGKFLHLEYDRLSEKKRENRFSDGNDFKIKKNKNDTLTLNYENYHYECSDTYVRDN